MGVHENVKLILLCDTKDFNGERNPVIVILPRTSMFDRFPGEYVSYRVISPFPQSPKMRMRLVKGEGSANERNIVGVEELVGNVGRDIGILWILGFTGDIDSSQGNLAIVRILEGLAIDAKSERAHDQQRWLVLC